MRKIITFVIVAAIFILWLIFHPITILISYFQERHNERLMRKLNKQKFGMVGEEFEIAEDLGLLPPWERFK